MTSIDRELMQRIVVIDDDPPMANLIAQALEEEGYKVFVGYDGQMAMQLISRQRPNLVICDMNMPMMHGGKVLEFMQANEVFRNIPIIFVSGAPANTIYPIIDGVHHASFLKKPIDIIELISFVQHTLAKHHPGSE